MDIIQEVDESMEESSRRRSGRKTSRKSSEQSPNQSMLRSEPEVYKATSNQGLGREKGMSEQKLIEDHQYEADMTAIVKEVD